MHRSNLLRLIEEGEHQTQDFKFAISDSKKIARSLVAFANTDGGRLLIGVKDNGAVAGVRSDEEFYMIEAASQMYCQPEIPFTVNQHSHNGKSVLEIIVDPSYYKLHKAPNKEGVYKVYVRVNDENMLVNNVYIRAMKQKTKPENVLRITKPVELLMQYMESNSGITFGQCMKASGVRRNVATHILAQLISLDIVSIHFSEKGAVYRLNENSSRVLTA